MSRENYTQSENIFGRNFRRWRDEHQLTLAQVAKMLDSAASYISEIERGEKFPSFEMLKKIRNELRIDLNNFISGDLTLKVSEKILDYQQTHINKIEETLEEIDKLADNIKDKISEAKRRKK